MPGRRERTLDARILRGARVWIRVENALFDNLVDGDCPVDTPAVTRYTRHAFDRRGRLLRTRVRTVCADFSATELR